MKAPAAKTEGILEQARDAWERFQDYWSQHRIDSTDDFRFARLEEQWPSELIEQRRREARPCETFNKLPSFIRQVVNDARQNKPAIKVHPADSGADVKTAEIINGLIRNIEVTSDADAATDTAVEQAVDRGLGYFRINTRYACDDRFEQDIVFERIMNPLTVFGDPNSQAVDSSDWNEAFITVSMTKDEFERAYPDADPVDWEGEDMRSWRDGDNVTVAEYWVREKIVRQIVALADGSIVHADEVPDGMEVVGEPREVESYKVTQHILTGAQVLKTVPWAGKYIPIVPVYGDEVVDETGKRHFISLIRPAKGAQRMYNYMRNTSIEMVALAPKVPFIGRKGAFDSDANWLTANKQSHAYLEYEGAEAPQRQGYAGVPAGVIQETLSANDDMKSIMGIYDASLGNRSNETSGRAIRARQMEGDTATFHFIDNLSRAIRHAGRILIDLIPKVYSTERMIRVLGEDMKPENVQIGPTGQAVQPQMDEMGQAIGHIYDITAGKYDLTVKAGPSFGTRREEAREEIVEVIRAVPASAPILGPMYLRNSDWPGAEEAADKLEGGGEPQIPPEIQEQMQQGMQLIQQLQAENEQLKADQAGKAAELQLKAKAASQKDRELGIKEYEAETARMVAQQPEIYRPPATQ
jgi:hypothetical protein